MKIQLKRELRGQFEEITVERGVTIEEIENLGFEEMIKAILDIVSSDELIKAFSVVLK